MNQSKRIQRENKTVSAMITLYCRDKHHSDHLCSDCERLRDYAHKRNANCPFGEQKPVCNRCQVHCYSAKYQQQIKHIMRYAGPRMLLKHPILALWHIIDSKRKIPSLDKTKTKKHA